VTLLGGGTLAILIAIELIYDPQDDRASSSSSAARLSSIALMTVQPSGTAVLGTYAAVASAVIRLPKRWALAVIIPIHRDRRHRHPGNASERFLVFAWTNIAYVFMCHRHLLRLSEDHQIPGAGAARGGGTDATGAQRGGGARRARPDRRELHDVLAHSPLGAVGGARGGRASWPSTATSPDVIAAIGRAHRHAASGLDEARAAIQALRGDSVPGPDKLEDLLEEMRAHGIECTLEIKRRDAAAPLRSGAGVFRSHRPGGAHQRAQARRGSRAGGDPPRLRPDGVQLIVADSHATVPNRWCAAGGAGAAPAPATG